MRPFPGKRFPGVLRTLWRRGTEEDRRDLVAFGKRYRRLASKGSTTTAEDIARFRCLVGYARALVDNASDKRFEQVRGLLWTTSFDDGPPGAEQADPRR